MSLINFDGNGASQQQDQQQQIQDIQAEPDRFKYPAPISDPDELANILSFKWRGKTYPIVDLQTDVSHDLVQHKYPNQDSARVEDMGRNPLMIKGTLVFVNTIEPARIEDWIKGDLYPRAYGQFLVDMFDGTTGTLTHPSLGDIQCKPMNCAPKLDGKFRGGEMVDAAWIETIDDSLTSTLTKTLNTIASTASALENELDNFPQIIIEVFGAPTGQSEGSFADFLNDIKSVIDSAKLAGQEAISSFNNIIYRCQTIIDSYNRNDDTQLAVLNSLATNLQGQAITLKQNATLTPNGKIIANFITEVDTTLGNLAKILNNSTTDLITLNPFLMKNLKILKGTLIKYYSNK